MSDEKTENVKKAPLSDKQRRQYRTVLKQRAMGPETIRAFWTGEDPADAAERLHREIDRGTFDPDSKFVKELMGDKAPVAPEEQGRKEAASITTTLATEVAPGFDSEVAELYAAARSLTEEQRKNLTKKIVPAQEAMEHEPLDFVAQKRATSETPSTELKPTVRVTDKESGEKEKERPTAPRKKESPAAKQRQAVEKRLEIEKEHNHAFQNKLNALGITKEEAWEVIDCLMLRNVPYRRTVQLFNRFSVEFQTRGREDYVRINESIERGGALSGLTISDEMWNKNLAASIVRYAGHSFVNTPVEERLEWVLTLQDPVFRLLASRLKEFDDFIAEILSPGFLRNF